METFTFEDYPGLTLIARVFENREIDSNVDSCIINPTLAKYTKVDENLIIKSICGKISGKPSKFDQLQINGTMRYIKDGLNCTYVGTTTGAFVKNGIAKVEKFGEVHLHCAAITKIIYGMLTIDVGISNLTITDIVDIKKVILKINHGTIKSGDNIAKIFRNQMQVKIAANGYLYEGECTLYEGYQFIPKGFGKITNLETMEILEGTCDFDDIKYLSIIIKNFYPKAMLNALFDQK